MSVQDLGRRRSQGQPADEKLPAGQPSQPGRGKGSLRPLRLLRPYLFRHNRIALMALLALVVASAATLVLPFAVREMIDRGFAPDNKHLINIYFAGLFAAGAG